MRRASGGHSGTSSGGSSSGSSGGTCRCMQRIRVCFSLARLPPACLSEARLLSCAAPLQPASPCCLHARPSPAPALPPAAGPCCDRAGHQRAAVAQLCLPRQAHLRLHQLHGWVGGWWWWVGVGVGGGNVPCRRRSSSGRSWMDGCAGGRGGMCSSVVRHLQPLCRVAPEAFCMPCLLPSPLPTRGSPLPHTLPTAARCHHPLPTVAGC